MKYIKKYENIRTHRGYDIVKNTNKSPGEYGLWWIPELYYRDVANKISKGFKSVSIIQCREAIDYWYDFSEKIKKIYI